MSRNKWSQIQEEAYSTVASDESTRVLQTESNKKKCIIEWSGTGKTIIDLGCNDGAISDALKKAGNTVFGFDFPKVAAIARRKYGVNAAAADLSNEFPIRSSCADMIIASAVLEHVPDDKLFLKECQRVLKPSGRVIIIVPNIAYLKNRVKLLVGYRMFNHVQDVNAHIHSLYTVMGLREFLSHLGFNITRMTGSHFRDESRKIDIWHALEKMLPPSFAAELIVEAEKND